MSLTQDGPEGASLFCLMSLKDFLGFVSSGVCIETFFFSLLVSVDV
jgi:hypothetical protein